MTLRIAYVCADPGIPVFGRKGASIHVQEMLRALAPRGAHLTLFAARFGGDAPDDLRAVRVHELPRARKGDVGERERAALAANADLEEALAAAGPFDLVYERYSLWSRAGMEHARARGVPAVLEVNAPLVEEQAAYRGLVDRVSAEGVARRALAAATVLVAVSDEVGRYLEGFPEAAGRVHVVPNGVDATRFRPGLEPALPRDEGDFVVGFVGSLKPWHGLETLAPALERLRERVPRARLLIVGDGPEREALETDLEARGLRAHAYFAGMVPPEDVPRWVAAMDVGLAPYPPLECFYFSPLKVYEYMAAGIPVVASGIGQLRSLIDDGVNGLLFDPGDSQALAVALARLHADPALRERLARCGRQRVLACHTWHHVSAHILRLAGVNPHGQ